MNAMLSDTNVFWVVALIVAAGAGFALLFLIMRARREERASDWEEYDLNRELAYLRDKNSSHEMADGR